MESIHAPAQTPPRAHHRSRWRHATTPRRLANSVFAFGVLATALAWMVTLRPQSLGGPAGYVLVRGTSMLPTYHTGDLVIVRRASAYGRGDVVAYRIPQGEGGAGIIVIHRIVGGTPAQGFVPQGDNNPAADDWRPKPADILGRAWLLVPRGGTFLAFLHAPLTLASLAAGIAVALLLVEPEGKEPRTKGGPLGLPAIRFGRPLGRRGNHPEPPQTSAFRGRHCGPLGDVLITQEVRQHDHDHQ